MTSGPWAKTSGPAQLLRLTKTPARDLLPDLAGRPGLGWGQEKVEGLAVNGDGHGYPVTESDGVQDASGETVFFDLGRARRLFGQAR